MTTSTRFAAGMLLLIGKAASILMVFAGFLFLVFGRLISQLTHFERFIGEIDGFSIALVFGGIAVALKMLERRLRTEGDLLTDDSD